MSLTIKIESHWAVEQIGEPGEGFFRQSVCNCRIPFAHFKHSVVPWTEDDEEEVAGA